MSSYWSELNAEEGKCEEQYLIHIELISFIIISKAILFV